MTQERHEPISPPKPRTGSPPSRLPSGAKRNLAKLYWLTYDTCDYLAEAVGWLSSNRVRCVLWRSFGAKIGQHSSVHRNCRFYRPSGVQLGSHTVVNRDVLLDGRMGLVIGDNASVSEGVAIFTLEHDPNNPDFANRGAPVSIADRAFIGARVIILPGVTVGEGAVVAAGAVVTHDVPSYSIVGRVPAKSIGERNRELSYTLDYRKFLG